jgi:hypothetical protein
MGGSESFVKKNELDGLTFNRTQNASKIAENYVLSEDGLFYYQGQRRRRRDSSSDWWFQ